MRKQGKVFRWDTAKGFGFIRSPDTDQEIFFHIRDYRGNTAPREGEAVWFEEIHVGGKGPRGMSVQPANAVNDLRSGASTSNKPKSRWQPAKSNSRHISSDSEPNNSIPILVLIFAWVSLIGWGITHKRIPVWALAAVVAVNLMTLSVYAHDKYAAQKGRWRVKEDTLHILSLIGGWPGAWFAQQTLRHKSRKVAFRRTYWATVFMHFSALIGWLLWLQPRMLLN